MLIKKTKQFKQNKWEIYKKKQLSLQLEGFDSKKVRFQFLSILYPKLLV
jgi:hypothetical protein